MMDYRQLSNYNISGREYLCTFLESDERLTERNVERALRGYVIAFATSSGTHLSFFGIWLMD